MGKYTNVYKGENPPKSKDVLWVHHEIKDDLTSPIVTEAYIKGKWRPQGSDGDGETGKYIEVEYDALKELRDSGNLKPGSFYRITDYECTTSQPGTRSAGHRFDIIVQALDEKTLSENASAIQHEYTDIYEGSFMYIGENTENKYLHIDAVEVILDRDNTKTILHRFDASGVIESDSPFWWVYIDNDHYSYIFNDEIYTVAPVEIDGVWHFRGYAQEDLVNGDDCTVDIASLYFSNSNLAAWKLKYCLDNDEKRFGWAKGIYLSPISHNKVMVIRAGNDNANAVSEYVRQAQLDNENGLAWAYEEDWTYDTVKEYCENGEESLDLGRIIYTKDENLFIGQKVIDPEDIVCEIIDFSEKGKGVIYGMIDEYNNECPYDFKNIQYTRRLIDDTGKLSDDEDEGTNQYVYTFNCYNKDTNQIEDASVNIYLLDDVSTICFNNIIKENYRDDGLFIELNNIVYLMELSLSEYELYVCFGNKIEDRCYDITLGDHNFDNIIRSGCGDIILKNACSNNYIGINSYNIVLEFDCVNNKIYNSCNEISISEHCRDNIFSDNCTSISLGEGCYYNKIGTSCNNIILGNHCDSNNIESDCDHIKFGKSDIIRDYYNFISIDSGNRYIYLYASTNTTGSKKYQNVKICQGVNNSNTWKTITDSNINQNYQTVYKTANDIEITV